MAPVTTADRERVERDALDRRIAELNGEIADLCTRRAALDAAPMGAALTTNDG